jgi:hypothetical protein
MPVVPFPLSPQLHYHHQLPVMLFVEIALRFPAPFLGLQINLHGEPMDQLIPGAQKGRPALPPGGARLLRPTTRQASRTPSSSSIGAPETFCFAPSHLRKCSAS